MPHLARETAMPTYGYPNGGPVRPVRVNLGPYSRAKDHAHNLVCLVVAAQAAAREVGWAAQAARSDPGLSESAKAALQRLADDAHKSALCLSDAHAAFNGSTPSYQAVG